MEADGRESGVFKRVCLIAVAVSALVFVGYALHVLFGEDPLDQHYGPVRQISVDEGPGGGGDRPVPDIHSRTAVRVAVAPIVSVERTLQYYTPLIDTLSGLLGREVVLIQRRSYAEVNEVLRARECDLAFVCTYPYVRVQRDFGAEAVAVPRIRGRNVYRAFVIVPADSGAETLLDLRGKRFASSDILSTAGWLFSAAWLVRNGEDPDRFFGRHVLTGSHDHSIDAVMRGYVDGASVQSLVYEKMMEEEPSIGEKTRIIMESRECGMPPAIVHPRMDPDLKERLRDALLRLHESEEGRAALEVLGYDRFEKPDERLYDAVREEADVWESRE
ncbi:MAG: substrate-binding domain-containing protein [Planctomycetota bacterium]|jgi:phosphonate transport system substrate-binding protein